MDTQYFSTIWKQVRRQLCWTVTSAVAFRIWNYWFLWGVQQIRINKWLVLWIFYKWSCREFICGWHGVMSFLQIVLKNKTKMLFSTFVSLSQQQWKNNRIQLNDLQKYCCRRLYLKSCISSLTALRCIIFTPNFPSLKIASGRKYIFHTSFQFLFSTHTVSCYTVRR